jgi:hypothetical protein
MAGDLKTHKKNEEHSRLNLRFLRISLRKIKSAPSHIKLYLHY